MDQKKIVRPILEDSVGYRNWIWLSPLKKVKETDEYTIYEREATLLIDEKESYLGAWHHLSDGKPFTRMYIVPTNLLLSKKTFEGFTHSLGTWDPVKSSFFWFKDFRPLNL